MALQPVHRIKLSEQIESQLKQQILAKKWKPGERLPSENELSDIFQVSRVSIRQALQSLSAQGLIQTRSGDGSFVNQPDIGGYLQDSIPEIYLADDPLRSVFEFRLLFEGPVAELATKRATDEQIHKLEELLQLMNESSNDPIENSKYDYQFHMQIGKMTQNLLIEGIYRLQNSIMLSCWKDINSTLGASNGLYYHKKILEAIELRDAEGCRKIMEEHIAVVWKLFSAKHG